MNKYQNILDELIEQYKTLRLEYLKINRQRLRYINQLKNNKRKIAYYKNQHYRIYKNKFKNVMENENVELITIINNIISRMKQIDIEINNIHEDIHIYKKLSNSIT